jgi:hypothetical protein
MVSFHEQPFGLLATLTIATLCNSYSVLSVCLACAVSRSHATWILVVGAHEGHDTLVKIAVTEFLHRIMKFADCIRRNDEVIRMATDYLWDAQNCVYRWVAFVLNGRQSNITESWRSLILSKQNWRCSVTGKHNCFYWHKSLGNITKNLSFIVVLSYTIFFWYFTNNKVRLNFCLRFVVVS